MTVAVDAVMDFAAMANRPKAPLSRRVLVALIAARAFAVISPAIVMKPVAVAQLIAANVPQIVVVE